jgi:hypothetical protein
MGGMTHEEWNTCIDPQKMLEFLRGKASDRKLRLFTVSCSRRLLHLTHDHRVREALDVAEQLADELVGNVERSNARKAARAASGCGVVGRLESPTILERRTASLAFYTAARRAIVAASNVPSQAVDLLVWVAGGYDNCDWRAISRDEGAIQSDLLREIFGNPFRFVSLDPAVLQWKDSTIVKLAQAIYDERAFDRLPILADALEDAACDDVAILGHCRQPEPHVRGCWIVDLLLGRK